ncbi:MAG: 8-amino-7-oxononanoate synthase [Steroidobacteraceae bacterium]
MRRTDDAVARLLHGIAEAQLMRQRRRVEGFARADRLTRVIVGGRELVNFCSNDYLGLARDPRLGEAMAQAAREWGAGSGAAHLVTGHTAVHHALEERLAAFTRREAALLFSTGYMANLGVVTSFAGRGETVVQDRLNHASLLDGAQLAGARLIRYAHADATAAARALEEAGENAALLATDGVFSMDGDVAPAAALARTARVHGVWLLLDDAHGLGVTGATGRGTLEEAGLGAAEVPLLVGTLGKAFGCCGAFVAGDRDLVEFVLQRARSYIYTTALPPGAAAAAHAALDIAERESWRREHLAQLIARFRAGAAQLGLPLGASRTPVQPLIVGETARCLAASDALRERGFWVAAIRRPTVPPGTERLRITLTAAHDDDEVDALLESLAAVLPAGSRT